MTQTDALTELARRLEDVEAQRDRLLVDNGALRAENAALRNAISDLTEHIFDAAQKAAHAYQLGQQLTSDQGDKDEDQP